MLKASSADTVMLKVLPAVIHPIVLTAKCVVALALTLTVLPMPVMLVVVWSLAVSF